MTHVLGPVLGLAGALALGGCATTSLVCRGNQESMLAAELLFGRRSDRAVVSHAEWARFVAQEITPRFPDGFTVIDAAGQWRDPRRDAIVREPSKIVLIAFRDDGDKQAQLAAIAESYKRRFNQQSVGIVIKSACVSF